MTVAFPVLDTGAAERWQRMRRDVHAWCGEAIDIFASVESAVGDALKAVDGAPSNGPALHLVGRKLDRLGEIVAKDGPFASLGGQIRSASKAFRQHDDLRRALCHGALMLTVDEAGAWVAILRWTSLRSSAIEAQVMVVTRAEAGNVLTALRSHANHLRGQLRRMLKECAGTGGAAKTNCSTTAALLTVVP